MTFPTGNESTGYSLFGMPVEVSSFLPDNIIMAVDPAGDDDASVIMDVKSGQITSLSSLYRDDDLVSDGSDLSETMRRAIALRHDDAYLSAIIGGTSTASTAAAETLDLFKMMDMIEQARMARLDQDKRLIGALLDVGFHVVCNEYAARPHAVLPADFKDAYDAVLEERKRRVL